MTWQDLLVLVTHLLHADGKGLYSLFVVRSDSVYDCRGAGGRSRGAAGVLVDIPPVSGFAASTNGWGAQVTPAAPAGELSAAVLHVHVRA